MVTAQVLGTLIAIYLTKRRFRERMNATAAEMVREGLAELGRILRAAERLAARLAASPYAGLIVALVALGLTTALLGSGDNAASPANLVGWIVTGVATAALCRSTRRAVCALRSSLPSEERSYTVAADAMSSLRLS